jgi:hypothetical protein
VTMRPASPPIGAHRRRAIRGPLPRVALACLLGVAAALLISCSGSGKGLIPTGNAGPLQSDFEAVAQAAQSGDGSCTSTEAALLKTDQDFAALPASVDSGLRNTLHQGIENLRKRALEMCEQPIPTATSTTTTPHTTTTTTTGTETTPTVTQTTSTQTTPPATTPAPSGPGGGTPAPGSEPTPGAGGESESGVGGAGEPGGAGGAKVGGGQEAGGK